MKTIYIRGFKVNFEEDARNGVNYLLYDLDEKEARIFFDQARLKNFANFEDDREGQYTLSYNPDGSYTLTRRE